MNAKHTNKAKSHAAIPLNVPLVRTSPDILSSVYLMHEITCK